MKIIKLILILVFVLTIFSLYWINTTNHSRFVSGYRNCYSGEFQAAPLIDPGIAGPRLGCFDSNEVTQLAQNTYVNTEVLNLVLGIIAFSCIGSYFIAYTHKTKR